MQSYIHEHLTYIENQHKDSLSIHSLYDHLRQLGLDDFGYILWNMPILEFPKISSLLPKMANIEVQKNWTGNSGESLLIQTLAFVRALSFNYNRFTNRSLDNSYILDFGCGYGRLARLMYYFTDPEKYWGVDPWNLSIEICKADGLGENFLLSDYLPSNLPFERKKFDLIFAFSVFTHLSERATKICLNTLAKYIKPDGIIAITIRPVEYWKHDKNALSLGCVSQQILIHENEGFSFLPHNRKEISGDITYGDTSITIEWIKKEFPDLTILGCDRSLCDPFQRYVFLKLS